MQKIINSSQNKRSSTQQNMNSIKGTIKLIFEEGIEAEYESDLDILLIMKKGSVIEFTNKGRAEVLEIDTYFKDTDNQVSFLIVAKLKLLNQD